MDNAVNMEEIYSVDMEELYADLAYVVRELLDEGDNPVALIRQVAACAQQWQEDHEDEM
jgi:hypothetical protein